MRRIKFGSIGFSTHGSASLAEESQMGNSTGCAEKVTT
jgi:hypothetical protein